jgi:hypothetical protein
VFIRSAAATRSLAVSADFRYFVTESGEDPSSKTVSNQLSDVAVFCSTRHSPADSIDGLGKGGG